MDTPFLSSYDPRADWTAEQPISIIRPRSSGCSCAPRTPHSFQCTDPAAVATLLQQRGYQPIRTRSDKEHARLIRGGALAVIYGSGSVVGQGPNPIPLLELLANLAGGEE